MTESDAAPEEPGEVSIEDTGDEMDGGDENSTVEAEPEESAEAEHLDLQLGEESSSPEEGLAEARGSRETLIFSDEIGEAPAETDSSNQIRAVRFAQLEAAVPKVDKNPELLNNVEVDVTVELGRKEMTVNQLVELKEQGLIELDKLAGEAFDIRVNGRLFAAGEVVVVTDLMAVRITSLYENPDTKQAAEE